MCFWSWEEMSWTVWDMFKAFATSFRHQNWFFNTKSEQIHIKNWWIFAFLRLLWAISFTITFTKGNYAAVPCCLNKTHPLLHRDKISRNYISRFSFLHKNKEFSYASFPHVFKAIRPLEKILETKNEFFSLSKKAVFQYPRILNGKTSKNDSFLTHFWNNGFIWRKPKFPKITYLPFESPIEIMFF